MPLKLITAPEDEPVSLEDIKDALKVVDTDDDDLLTALNAGARAHAEKYLGRALIDQTWDFYLDDFPEDDDAIELPLPPAIEVVGVFYNDGSGSEATLSASDYDLDLVSEPARISIGQGSWPDVETDAINAVRVRFRAGYLNGDSPPTEDVPKDIKTAIKLLVKADYDGGPDAEKNRAAAERLLSFHRHDLSMA